MDYENISHAQRVKMRTRYKKLMRKLWSQSPYREAALKAVKENRPTGQYHKNGRQKFKVQYRCGHCGRWFNLEEVEVDHIQELYRINWRVPLDEDLGELAKWFKSLFCPSSNLMVLCKKCHAIKTAEYGKYLNLGGDML